LFNKLLHGFWGGRFCRQVTDNWRYDNIFSYILSICLKMKAILAIKKDMTSLYDGEKIVPVTVLDTKGCVITELREHGLEMGIGNALKTGKTLSGKYSKVGYVPRFRRFVSGVSVEGCEVGGVVSHDGFEKNSKVKVQGVSKGKGFQGVVKRWNMKGGQRTHGQSDRLRAIGAIGAGTDPGRIFKGKRMAGRMGGDTMSYKNMKIVDVREDLIMLKGSVPGNRNSVVLLTIV